MFGNEPRWPQGSNAEQWWPKALPSTNLDYGLNVNAAINAVGDRAASATLSIAPSGTGELQALDLICINNVVVAQLTGGQPGRVYRIQISVTGVSGRVWTYVVHQLIGWGTAVVPPVPPPAPNPGFGTPLTATATYEINVYVTYGTGTYFVEDGLGNFYIDASGNFLECNPLLV